MNHYLRIILIRFLLAGYFMIFISAARSEEGPDDKRQLNILFIMSDQNRGDRIDADGEEWIKTPNLDELAGEGVLFKKAYCSVPSCKPARVSILTGMSPWQSGQLGYTDIPENLPYEMPRMFTNAGYRTHAAGKNHFTPMRTKHGYQTVELEEAWHSTRKGAPKCDYQIWFEKELPGENLNASGLHYTDHRGGVAFPFDDEYHPTYWTAEKAVQFLKDYDGENPWLMKVSFQRPHPPFDPPQRWLDYYHTVDIPETKVGNWAEEKYGHKLGSLNKLKNPTSGNFSKNEIEASRRAYYAAISFVDEQIGRVIEALKDRGEYKNTLIIYTADHGDMMGDHHMWRKCRPYEGSARIPMIMRWPEHLGINAKRGLISSKLVELRDILPTFLDATGMEQPTSMDGRSMLAAITGKPWRKILDLEHAQIYEKDNAWVALTDGQYKYIYFTLTGQQQLFDLQKDPYEMIDLASSKYYENNKELVLNWRKKMTKHLKIRGEKWVKDGQLVVHENPIRFGANHPKFKNQKQ